MSEMITTDAYGQVSAETFDFLKDHHLTPAEWAELVHALGDHGACKTFISEFTVEGRYDSWRGGRALDRRGHTGR